MSADETLELMRAAGLSQKLGDVFDNMMALEKMLPVDSQPILRLAVSAGRSQTESVLRGMECAALQRKVTALETRLRKSRESPNLKIKVDD
jgi:hypothetical protein